MPHHPISSKLSIRAGSATTDPGPGAAGPLICASQSCDPHPTLGDVLDVLRYGPVRLAPPVPCQPERQLFSAVHNTRADAYLINGEIGHVSLHWSRERERESFRWSHGESYTESLTQERTLTKLVQESMCLQPKQAAATGQGASDGHGAIF